MKSSVTKLQPAGTSGRPQGVSEDEWQARVDVATACRVVALFGWTDLIATHISAVMPGADNEFLINPYGVLFEETTPECLVRVDRDGNFLSPSEHPISKGGFAIHSAIHTARPDARYIIHLHTRDGVGVSMQENGLLPASQFALAVWHELSYHDYEGFSDNEERARIVADLGDKRLMVLRNHGTLSMGETISEAFAWSYRLERACRMQITAQSGGSVLKQIPQGAIEKAMQHGRSYMTKGGISPAGQREWAAVVRKLEREDPTFNGFR
ncbi:MAG: class II aldolase/adducin family protein [Burkholderiales bacterium]